MTTTGYLWRQPRLNRGWDPTQLRLVFLWENQRATVPGYYATLLHRVFTTPVPHHYPAVTS